jgi:cystine transport system substrate-binding protein
VGASRSLLFPRSAAFFALAAAGALVVGVGAGAAGKPGSLSSIESQKRSAILDLYALDSRLTAAQQRLTALERQAAALRAQQQLLQLQVGATRVTLRLSLQRLAENLRDLYKRGDVNTLAVVLGSQSLDDAVSQIDTLNAVAAQDRRMVSVTTRAERRLAALRRTLAAHRARIAAAVGDARRTLDSLTAAREARVAFIGRLRTQEQLKRAQIQALQARVAVAQQKSAQLTAQASPPSSSDASSTEPAPAAPPTPAPSGGRTITVSSTGYSLPGHTATGLPVGWGVVAVDPNVIPLGTKLTIPGYGEAVAADTGSAVRGYDIDIWFPTLAQARAWGRRTVTITLH